MESDNFGDLGWTSEDLSTWQSKQTRLSHGDVEQGCEAGRTGRREDHTRKFFQREDGASLSLNSSGGLSDDSGFYEPTGFLTQDPYLQLATSPSDVEPCYFRSVCSGYYEPPSPLLQQSDLTLGTWGPNAAGPDSSDHGDVSGLPLDKPRSAAWSNSEIRCEYNHGGCEQSYSRGEDLHRHQLNHAQDLYVGHRIAHSIDGTQLFKTERPITTAPRQSSLVIAPVEQVPSLPANNCDQNVGISPSTAQESFSNISTHAIQTLGSFGCHGWTDYSSTEETRSLNTGSQEIVFSLRSADPVPIKKKRIVQKAEREESQNIRGHVAPCNTCQRSKRKCKPSHIDGRLPTKQVSSSNAVSEETSSWAVVDRQMSSPIKWFEEHRQSDLQECDNQPFPSALDPSPLSSRARYGLVEEIPDVLLLRHRMDTHEMSFAPHGISDGVVTIQEVRKRAAEILGCEPQNLILMYNGKVLSEGGATAKAYAIEHYGQLVAVDRSRLWPVISANISKTSSDLKSEQCLMRHQEATEHEREYFELLASRNGAVSEQKQQKSDSACSLIIPIAPDAVHDTAALTRSLKADPIETGSADSPNSTSRSEGEMSFMHSDEECPSPVPWTPVIDGAFSIVSVQLAALLVKSYFATALTALGREGTSQRPDAPAGSTSTASTPTTSAPTASAPPATSTSAVHPTAWQTAQKRKFQSDKEEENRKGDDENDRDRPHDEPNSNHDSVSKPLACPYFKNEPRRYSERNSTERSYRSCSTCLLKDISRLKQHLYRVHRRPDHYCGRCYQVCRSEALLEEHVRSDPRCQLSGPLFQEKMTVAQIEQIKRRRPGKSVSDNWYGIFKILFPDSTPPESPYVESLCTEGIQRFLSFVESQGNARLQQLLLNELQQEPFASYLTQQIVAEAVERAVPLFMRGLLQQFSTTAQSLDSSLQDEATAIQVETNTDTAVVAPEVWGNQADAPSAPPPSFREAVQVLRESELNSATYSQDVAGLLNPEDQYLFNMNPPGIENDWLYLPRAAPLSTETA